MKSRRARALTSIAVAVTLVFGASACSAPSPKPSPTATSTPSAVPTATPTPHEPTALFDGDCAAILSDDALSQLLGEPMRNVGEHWKADDIGRLGGISCSWSKTGVYRELLLFVTAIPEESLAGNGDALTCDDEQTCAEDTVNAIRVRLSIAGYSAQIDPESMSELMALVTKRVAAQPTPVVDHVRAGWWTLTDCESILARVAPELGLQLEPQDPTVRPGVATSVGTELYCPFYTVDDTGYVSSYGTRFSAGGAPDVVSALAADGAYEVAVEGAARAAFAPDPITYDASYPLLVATDGMNLLDITILSPEDGFDDVSVIASALLQALAD